MTNLTMLGQVLHEEHFRILVCLCDLHNRVSGEAGEQPFDPDDDGELAAMHALISTFDGILTHHAFEESNVFSLIRDDGGSGVADLLEEEHVIIEPMTQRLRALAIEILKHGPGAGRWREFRSLGLELFAQMLGHLEREEAIVARLDCLLDTATDHRLALQHLSSRLLPGVASSSRISR